jgi:hypothetical protein
MPDDTPSDEPRPSKGRPSQSGGLNIDGDASIGGNAVGRDSITHTTTATNTTSMVVEGGPVARYAVLGVVGIAALAIIVIAFIASGNHPAAPTATPTPTALPTLAPSQTPSPPASPTVLLPTETATHTATAPPSTVTPSPTEPPTATEPARPTPTATEGVLATLTAMPWPTSALPLYDNFAGTCLRKDNWMLDWQWQSPTPTPGAPLCLDTRPQYMAADDGLGVFLGLDDTRGKRRGETHSLTTAAFGYLKQIEVRVALNKVETLTDTRSAYLSVIVPAHRANPADLEIRVQGGTLAGKPVYQITSLLNLRDGSGIQQGQTLTYVLGQPIVVAFRVKSNKLTGYVNDQVMIGPYSILAEPTAVTIGYQADEDTLLDGTFDEVHIVAITASEIRPGPTLTAVPTPP